MSVRESVLAFDASAAATELRSGEVVAEWCAIASVVDEDGVVVVRIERDGGDELVVTLRPVVAVAA